MTIRLVINRLWSSLNHPKYITARYYFIKDKIKDEEVGVQYCLTKEMWSDILNKPKNGIPFQKYRSKLMNVPVEYEYNVKTRNTHPNLLPKGGSLETVGIKRPRVLSRSVLTKFSNVFSAGISMMGWSKCSRNRASWSEIVILLQYCRNRF